MSQVTLHELCTVCFARIRWYHDWIGTVRYDDHSNAMPFWIGRAHYKCWKKVQENARTATAQVPSAGLGDEFSMRMEQPKP